MFELFIALFGGGYYGNKLLNEHIDHKEADNRRTEVKTRRDQWCSMVTDRALEEELRLFISRPENQDAVLEQVSEVYDKILDGRRIDEFYPRELWCKKKKDWSHGFHEEVQEIVCRRDSRNALRIMLAKRGRLTGIDAVNGVSRSICAASKLEAEVIMWCAGELKRHGLKEMFSMPTPELYGVRGMGWEV